MLEIDTNREAARTELIEELREQITKFGADIGHRQAKLQLSACILTVLGTQPLALSVDGKQEEPVVIPFGIDPKSPVSDRAIRKHREVRMFLEEELMPRITKFVEKSLPADGSLGILKMLYEQEISEILMILLSETVSSYGTNVHNYGAYLRLKKRQHSSHS
jgi:hypothetical protein